MFTLKTTLEFNKMKISIRNLTFAAIWVLFTAQIVLTGILLFNRDFHDASTSFTLSFWMFTTIYFEAKYRKLVKEREKFKSFLDEPREFN
jgi:hypothetical protein